MTHTLSYFALALQRDFATFCNVRLQELGLSQGLLYFIIYAGKHPDCSPGSLAAALHMDTGHTARSLDKLEQAGFMLREKNQEDKRAYRLRLTARGDSAFKEIFEMFVQWDEFTLKGLDKKERTELLRILEKVVAQKEDAGDVRQD